MFLFYLKIFKNLSYSWFTKSYFQITNERWSSKKCFNNEIILILCHFYSLTSAKQKRLVITVIWKKSLGKHFNDWFWGCTYPSLISLPYCAVPKNWPFFSLLYVFSYFFLFLLQLVWYLEISKLLLSEQKITIRKKDK